MSDEQDQTLLAVEASPPLDMNSLFEKDPELITDQEIDQIVHKLRAERESFLAKEQAKKRGEKIKIETDDLLGDIQL